MKKIILLLTTILVFIHSDALAQISAKDIVSKMGRGINLGNTLSAPIEGNWADPVKKTYFEDVANAGFKTVRIPIRFDKYTTALSEVNYTDANGDYTGSVSDYAIDKFYLDRIEEVISWALEYKLYAIIDVHGDKWFWESFKSNSEYYKTGNDLKAAIDRFLAIWTAISQRFSDYPEQLLFEIMNEPYFAMDAEQVTQTNLDILKIIRKTNPNRNIIITGGGKNSWESVMTIKEELLKSDSFLIATFHYYKPSHFTKSSREGFDDFEWGTDEDKSQIDLNFEAVADWSKTNDIPILLGEFGADNEGGYNYYKKNYKCFGGPTKESRERYYEYLANKAIKLGFCFTVWDAGEKSSKTIYLASSRSWVENIKKAVLGNNSISTKELPNNYNCTVFPNPCTGTLHINSNTDFKWIYINNQKGILVKKISKNIFNADMSELPTGFYYIAVYFKDNRKKVFKILKAK